MRFFKREKISKEEHRYITFTAYDALIEFNERSLPVLPTFSQIIDSSIYIFPMQFVARKQGIEEDYFTYGGSGMAMYVDSTGHYIILYDEKLPADRIRWTIARLIYLTKSGRLEDSPNVFHYADHCADPEKCDAFAYQFTCPDSILNECNINSASDIIKYCEIPFSFANIKSRMLKTSKKIKSLQFLETALKVNFRSYIDRISKE